MRWTIDLVLIDEVVKANEKDYGPHLYMQTHPESCIAGNIVFVLHFAKNCCDMGFDILFIRSPYHWEYKKNMILNWHFSFQALCIFILEYNNDNFYSIWP